MQIGSLFDNRLDKGVKYSYRRRGLDELYFPNNKKEEFEREYYTRDNGNLFYGKQVSWYNSQILADGVDIRIEFDDVCYIDHVVIVQGSSIYDAESDTTYNAEMAEIEVFTKENGELKKIGTHKPQTGKNIEDKEFSVSVGAYASNLTLRINSNYMPVAINKLDVWGAWELNDSIWPLPEKAEFSKEFFDLSLLNTIKASGEDAVFAAEFLQKKFALKTGKNLEISDKTGEIELVLEEKECKDSYKLSVKDGKCVIAGMNRRTLLYGLCAFLQIIDGDKVKCCEVEHEAYMDIRGVHFAIPGKKSVEFLKSIVENLFVPMNYNMAIIEFSAAMRFDNFPEIADSWVHGIKMYYEGKWPRPAHSGFVSEEIWEKSEIRELCDYIESFGIEIVPEVQTFGHVQYITMAYPHLAEIDVDRDKKKWDDLNAKDAKPSEFYHHTMCPNHPDYYRVTLGIIDEIIEVVKPKRFVHCGHDEVYQIGTCEICKDIPNGEILAKELTALNDHVKSKGLNMMIWADMLQCMDYSIKSGINDIPKDIIMLDFVWYFHLRDDIEVNLLDNGFKVVMGNMYSSHYPRFEKRAARDGMIGAQGSAWVPATEDNYAYEGKMFEYIYAATMLGNASYRSDMRKTYNEIIKPLIKDLRYTIGDLNCDGEEIGIDIKGERINIPYDVRDILAYDGAIKAGVGNNTAEIEVDSFAKTITFVHATDKQSKRVMWAEPYKIGEYAVVYEDGSEYTEELFYAKNIYKYRSPFGDRFEAQLFRHEGYAGTYLQIPECGKTYEGEDYTIGHYTIKNPNPDKKISKIVVKHLENADANILLFNIKIKK